MLALVSLREGRRSSLSTLVWPEPEPAEHAWVELGVGVSARDLRAFGRGDFPWWLDDELWVAELGGRIERQARSLRPDRARLVTRVESWDAVVAEEFVGACELRLKESVVATLRGAGRESDADALAAADDIEAAAARLESGDSVGQLAGLLRDVRFYARDAGGGARAAATSAYVAAHAGAGADKHAPGYAARFAEERRWQARWLDHRLSLAELIAAVRVV